MKQTPRRLARERFTRKDIEEIKTTGKLLLCIVTLAVLAVGCYLWLAGGVPTRGVDTVASPSDAAPEASTTKQADGDPALLTHVRAQQACDEGNKEACALLKQPDPLDIVNEPSAPARKK